MYMKRVRKKESSLILASQNIEDFLLPDIKEFTKPLFSIPTHHFLFYPGNINAKDYEEALMVEPNEYQLIRFSSQVLVCIVAVTRDICSRSSPRNTSHPCLAKQAADNRILVQENLRIFLRRFVDKVDFFWYHNSRCFYEAHNMIGDIVTVTVDRPIGSYHPEHKDIYYLINYGYIEGTMAPDGEWQDAYILGVDRAVERFTGKVIAIIHRIDDIEDKWVVCPDNCMFSQEEILEKVSFQEQFFQVEIIV